MSHLIEIQRSVTAVEHRDIVSHPPLCIDTIGRSAHQRVFGDGDRSWERGAR